MHLNLFEILFEQVYVPSRIKGLCHNYKLRETFLKILRPKVKQQSFIIRSAISFRELETALQPYPVYPHLKHKITASLNSN